MRAKKERARSTTKAAVLITAAVIAASGFLGCNRSLNALRRETAHTLMFSNANADPMDHHSIVTDGRSMANIAHNVMTVAKKYLVGQEETYAQLEACCQQMDNALFEAADVRTAAVGIRGGCADLIARLESVQGLSEEDRAYLVGFGVDLDGYIHRMENDPYNDAAEEFNRKLETFPANVLGLFVEPLQTVTF